VFASELGCLLRHPAVGREPNAAAIDDFLSLRYVPGPGSIVRSARRLAAGALLLWQGGRALERRWWTLPPALPAQSGDRELLEQFSATLDESIALRTMGEVPLGAYLSGGLDSGTIAAGLAAGSTEALRTFCVGFGWDGDELPQARAFAGHIGARHREIACGPDDLALLPSIVAHLGDPQGDAIVLPTWRLAATAAQDVTIVQSGDGADEVLGGYLFHRVLLLAERYRTLVPGALHRSLVAPLARHSPQWLLEALFDYPGRLGAQGRARVLDGLALLEPGPPEAGWRFLITLFDARERAALFTPEFAEQVRADRHDRPLPGWRPRPDHEGAVDRILAVQLDDWLPDNILHRADALSMAHGLEARVPFLDHQLVELLQQVPARLKVGARRGKLLLRQHAAARQLPVGLARRRKRPFYIPIERWGGHPALRDLLAATTDDAVVRRRGVLRPEAVAGLRQQLDSGDFLSFKKLFALVVLELWFQVFLDRTHGVATNPKVRAPRHANPA
jgi:asparagine synthase (glutamine-hydrolysing)